MPDAHTGYGMPIGGVLFADRAVVPYAIGVDIGCGVALLETDLTVETLLDAPSSGQRSRRSPRACPWRPEAQARPVDREARRRRDRASSGRTSVKEAWFDRRPSDQLGTLGGATTSSRSSGTRRAGCYVMLHSGSRSLGKTICDEYHKRALAQNTEWHSALPHPELAYLPVGDGGLRRLLGGDGVRAPVRGGEPLADARRRGGGLRRRTRRSGGWSGWWTSTTTTPPGRTTSAGTASSTARAPCAPGRVTSS